MVLIALYDDPESISASISVPLIVVMRRGKLLREIRAAVIIGRSVYCGLELKQRCPPPGASLPPCLCPDDVLGNNGMLAAAPLLYFAMNCMGLAAVCPLLLFSWVMPRLHRLRLALLYPCAR